jgi:hypothetical protein
MMGIIVVGTANNELSQNKTLACWHGKNNLIGIPGNLKELTVRLSYFFWCWAGGFRKKYAKSIIGLNVSCRRCRK